MTATANLAAMAIHSCALRQEIDETQQGRSQTKAEVAALRQVRAVTFAHSVPSQKIIIHYIG